MLTHTNYSRTTKKIDMLVSYKSDLVRIQKTLRLIIKYLANLKPSKNTENLWKIIMPVKLGLNGK